MCITDGEFRPGTNFEKGLTLVEFSEYQSYKAERTVYPPNQLETEKLVETV